MVFQSVGSDKYYTDMSDKYYTSWLLWIVESSLKYTVLIKTDSDNVSSDSIESL